MNVRRIEVIIISAVAIHSFILGVALLCQPFWALEFAGWDYNGSRFFPAQSGIFLIILSGAYFAGIKWRQFAWFLVMTKATAVIFLISESFYGGAPVRTLLLSALLDGLMGAAVAVALVIASRRPYHQICIKQL